MEENTYLNRQQNVFKVNRECCTDKAGKSTRYWGCLIRNKSTQLVTTSTSRKVHVRNGILENSGSPRLSIDSSTLQSEDFAVYLSKSLVLR